MGLHTEQRTRTTPGVARFLAPLACCSALLLPAVASAHMGSSKSIEARLEQGGARLTVQIDTIDAALALGLPATADAARIAKHEVLLRGWLAAGIAVAGEGGACLGRAHAPSFSSTDTGKPIVRVELDYACPAPIGALTLRDDTVFADDPDHETFVSLVTAEGRESHVLRASERELSLGTVASAWQTLGAFVREGAVHLVTGYDHMLFLLSLVLSAGMLAKISGLRRSLRDVAMVVTAFTLGHSLSLAAAALGWVALPSRLVESAIAASIVVVAGLNIARPQARVAKPWIAGAFGLVHGFGFSSVLADLGLPTAHRALALAGFNVGIELAQLAFVSLVMLPLVWAAGHRNYPLVVVRGGSLAIAACGCVWLVERGLGL
jgi:HupE / UreJ protein